MTIVKNESRTKPAKKQSDFKKTSGKPAIQSDRDKSVSAKNLKAATNNISNSIINTKPTTNKSSSTKQSKIINLLQRQKGATLAELSKMTGWQDHSIRGFMSGTLKKRLSLNVISEKNSKGTRRYRIENSEGSTTPLKPAIASNTGEKV